MPTIRISGPAQALADNPRSGTPITDPQQLMRLHGLASQEETVEYLEEPELMDIGLTGGRLRFVVENGQLRITTVYQSPRPLTEAELEALRTATEAQWSDGAGSGAFYNFGDEVLSTTLAMALGNSGSDELGECFVDPYPMDVDQRSTIEVLEDDADKPDRAFLEEAAAAGDPQALCMLGREVEDEDPEAAFTFYQQAAQRGHMLALVFVGLCCQRGRGTTENLKTAFDCFRKAADFGVPLGMHCLADCYMEGRGVARDPAQGIALLQRGADLGDPGCTAELGECYEKGQGVPQDLRQALELYERCMEAGFDAVEPAIQRVRKQLGED